MPFYRYKCQGCGHDFKHLKKPGRNGSTPECPKCGSDEVERVMSKTFGIRFKGNGFYRTDYKNNGNGRAGNSTTSETNSENSEESSSSED